MRRSALLVLTVAVIIIMSKLLLEDVLGIQLEPEVASWLARPSTSGAVAVVGLLAIDLFLPVPSSLVMILSGAIFGVVWGSVLAFVGSVGGEWLGFEIVRRFGRRAATALVGDDQEIARLNEVFARHGAAAIAATRALPVVMETMSIVAGLSTISRGTFLLASTAGTLPIVIVYAYAGARSKEAGTLVPAVIILIAVTACGWIWYRARFTKR